MDKKEFTITIQDIYPHLNDQQCREAEENLEQYLGVILRIYERLEREQGGFDSFKNRPYDGS